VGNNFSDLKVLLCSQKSASALQWGKHTSIPYKVFGRLEGLGFFSFLYKNTGDFSFTVAYRPVAHSCRTGKRGRGKQTSDQPCRSNAPL